MHRNGASAASSRPRGSVRHRVCDRRRGIEVRRSPAARAAGAHHAREGLIVESQTLYDQIEALARVLWPAYDRLGAELLEEPVLFADETPWPLLGKDVASAKWHAWVMASPKGAYYEIHDTRGLEAGKSMLGGYKGIGVTDGYGVYDALEKRIQGLRLAQCWAHIRRKFVDCESAFPKETEQILALIAALYAIEDRAPPGPEGDPVRQQIRTTESRCVLARIQAWCVDVACTPGSGIAGAIEYMSRRWSKATLFLEHAAVPLDNNGAERALARSRPRAQESLRLEVASWHRGRRGLLHAHRVGEARQRRALGVPHGGHQRGARRSERHAAAAGRHCHRVAGATTKRACGRDFTTGRGEAVRRKSHYESRSQRRTGCDAMVASPVSTDFHAYAIKDELFSKYGNDRKLEALTLLADIEVDLDDLELSHQLADDWVDSILGGELDEATMRKHIHELLDAGEVLEDTFELGGAWQSLEQAFAKASVLKSNLACCFRGGEKAPLGPEFSVLRNPDLTKLSTALGTVELAANLDCLASEVARLRDFYAQAATNDWVVIRCLA